MRTWQFILVILVCIALTFAIGFAARNDAEENHSAYYEKGDGICPVCGAELVKGVYGSYAPNFIWYCPDCP